MIKEQFLKAFEPEIAISVILIGKRKLEIPRILGKLVQFFTKDYYHLTDAQNAVVYLKRKEKS